MAVQEIEWGSWIGLIWLRERENFSDLFDTAIESLVQYNEGDI